MSKPDTSDQAIPTEERQAFNATYREWLAEQNSHHEQYGLWCDGLVAWQGGDGGGLSDLPFVCVAERVGTPWQYRTTKR